MTRLKSHERPMENEIRFFINEVKFHYGAQIAAGNAVATRPESFLRDAIILVLRKVMGLQIRDIAVHLGSNVASVHYNLERIIYSRRGRTKEIIKYYHEVLDIHNRVMMGFVKLCKQNRLVKI